MSTISRGLPILVNVRYAGFGEVTATNELVVDEAGTTTGSTILLFANRRHLVLHHLGVAGLQAVTARNENVHVLQIARASALGTVDITGSWLSPENYFYFY